MEAADVLIRGRNSDPRWGHSDLPMGPAAATGTGLLRRQPPNPIRPGGRPQTAHLRARRTPSDHHRSRLLLAVRARIGQHHPWQERHLHSARRGPLRRRPRTTGRHHDPGHPLPGSPIFYRAVDELREVGQVTDPLPALGTGTSCDPSARSRWFRGAQGPAKPRVLAVGRLRVSHCCRMPLLGRKSEKGG